MSIRADEGRPAVSRTSLSASRPRQRSRRLDRLWSILYAAPALVFVLAFLAYPLVRVFGYALTSWNGVGPAAGVGLKNFSGLLHDPIFLAALRNNVIYAISVPVEVIGALLIAHLLYERVPGWRFFRSAFFLPAVYSTVVIGIIAGVLLQANGPIDNGLRAGGLSFLARNWLGSSVDARIAIIAIVVWANFGYSVLIYLAGMSALDPQLAEAARLDGAGSWYILFRVHGPNLRGVMQLVLVINTVTAFAYMFTYIYVITAGGPGFSTYSAEFFIYDKAFTFGELGYASAAGVILTLIIAALGYFQIRWITGGDR
jgi:ABC-type sugar transport system permease subunit